MEIPGRNGINPEGIEDLITLLRGLSQRGPEASGPRGSQGCQGDQSQEFRELLTQIRDKLESLESGRFGNDDNRNGFNIRIS
jgi:hypothetical protein